MGIILPSLREETCLEVFTYTSTGVTLGDVSEDERKENEEEFNTKSIT